MGKKVLKDVHPNENVRIYLAGCFAGFFGNIIGIPVDHLKVRA
jgi:hypothetical protein